MNSLVQERAEDRPPHPEEGRRVAVVYRTDPHGERTLDCFHHHPVAPRVDLLYLIGRHKRHRTDLASATTQ